MQKSESFRGVRGERDFPRDETLQTESELGVRKEMLYPEGMQQGRKELAYF